MKLRKLDRDDALSMLEWMHDPSVVENLQADFASMRIEDCERFIESAQTAVHDLHLAIADDKDEYQGTVSLKHISGETAEFAIAIRKSAMGKGFSEYGMKEMLRIAFERLGLAAVYWCVSPENRRACRFYDKQGYRRFDVMKDSELYRDLVRGVPARTHCRISLVSGGQDDGRREKRYQLNTVKIFPPAEMRHEAAWQGGGKPWIFK